MEPTILTSNKYSHEEIIVNYNEISKRKIDTELEEKVDKFWLEFYKQAIKENKIIFDGESYRLDGFEENSGKLVIEMSKIKFSKRLPLSRVDGVWNYSNDYQQNGLAIGGFIKTKDNKYIFGVKSGDTISKQTVDFIGGMLEDEHIPQNGQDLFNVNIREIEEEAGIDKSFINTINLIGLIRSKSTTIVLLTFIELNLSENEVKKIFSVRHDSEMSDLIFKKYDELENFCNELGSYKPLSFALFKKHYN